VASPRSQNTSCANFFFGILPGADADDMVTVPGYDL
jgi:hypothetical protein